jgi:hypothetical protein
VPAFGALIAEPVYVLSDTAIVGHLGTAQLAGLAVAAAILVTGYSVFIFLAYGTTAAVARLIGAGDQQEATHQAVQGVWLAAAVSVPVTAVGLVLAGPLVRGFGASGAAGYAETYLRISALGLPAVLMTYAAVGWLRGRQDTRTPLLVAVVSAAVNLALEIVLILGLGYGVGASAASTVLGVRARRRADGRRRHALPRGDDGGRRGAVPGAGRDPGRHRRGAGLAVDGDRRAHARPAGDARRPAAHRRLARHRRKPLDRPGTIVTMTTVAGRSPAVTT